jgi:UDP-glucose 4-epimerase
MRWLITGGCGFIGRNLLIRAAKNSNAAFRIVDDLSTGTRQELAAAVDFIELDAADRSVEWTNWSRSRVELVRADIRDLSLARNAAVGADVVVHLAANTGVGPSIADPMHDGTLNVLGTLNYLEACRANGVRRFVFASSGATIGECQPPIHEELAPHPVSPYGASKLAGEAYCAAYSRSFGIYVDDIVDAIMLAATVEAIGGEVLQIASNTETTVSELAAKLAEALQLHGISPPKVHFAKPRLGDVRRNYSNTAKARNRLGWAPKVSLDRGLDRTVRWFVEARRGARLSAISADGAPT